MNARDVGRQVVVRGRWGSWGGRLMRVGPADSSVGWITADQCMVMPEAGKGLSPRPLVLPKDKVELVVDEERSLRLVEGGA